MLTLKAGSKFTPVEYRRMLDRAQPELHIGANLTVDMRAVRYFEHSAMVCLLATIAKLTPPNGTVEFLAPTAEKAFDYLQSWRFFDALPAVCERASDRILSGDTKKEMARRFETKHVSRYERTQAPPDDEWRGDQPLDQKAANVSVSWLPPHHFPISRIEIAPETALQQAVSMKKHWMNENLQLLLASQLREADRLSIANTVIFEGIKNAGTHPNAGHVHTSAQLKVIDEHEFVVCIWDDGDSVAQTLADGHGRYGRITTPGFEYLDQVAHVKLWDGTNPERDTPTLFRIDSQQPPDEESELALLIAAFFLGVTSIPTVRDDSAQPPKTISDQIAQKGGPGIEFYGGLGLYLIRYVAALAGGSVEYLNGRYHLTLRGSDDPEHFQVDVVVSPAGRVPVLGNLLIARFPKNPGA